MMYLDDSAGNLDTKSLLHGPVMAETVQNGLCTLVGSVGVPLQLH